MDSVLIILGAALLLGMILLALTRVGRSPRRHLDKQFVKKKWQEINETAAASGKHSRYAVIEADKLLDHVLKIRGYPGETMGERLKTAGKDFSYRDDVWSAHKLRNKLVHEADYEVNKRLIDRALNQFRQALKDLGAL